MNSLMQSWALSPFKFQWQQLRDEYLRPRDQDFPQYSHTEIVHFVKNTEYRIRVDILRARRHCKSGFFLLYDWRHTDYDLAGL